MGFIARAVGRRVAKVIDDVQQTPEGRAAIERGERRVALVQVAAQMAGSGLDDDAACAALRVRLPHDRELVRDGINYLGALRISYLDDRAYRLLTAAVDGSSVRPIDPAVREQFLAEAQLGRMSLDDAFAYLVSLEPRLHDLLERRLEAPGSKRNGFRFSRSEPQLVGPLADSPHAVVNTDLARGVVVEYLSVRRDGRQADQDPTPFFERKRRTFTGTFRVFGKTQPSAQN
ncbi:MAG TPA: hypothetical protein VN880_21350 [Solirubrobacteraceae bacterium]|jgi:hypothetical protein|nr:hypothetical protein [Solirubrobacteraceae bacterium]